jgi:pimeloyl-ACP methyl ester carboxylesterase
MAQDVLKLIDNLGIEERIHRVGYDIGGMIAYAFAARYPERLASVVWGECPLPETKVYESNRITHAVKQFHFIFHSVLDLPETLVAGRGHIYPSHFFSRLSTIQLPSHPKTQLLCPSIPPSLGR